MANPTVTIQIKEIGSKNVIDKLRLVRGEAAKLVAVKKRLGAASTRAKAQNAQEVISMRRLGRQMTLVRRSQEAARKSGGQLGTTFRNLGSAAIFAVGPLSGFGARLVAFSAIAQRTSVKVAIMAAGFAAMAVVLFKTISAMARTTIEVNKIENALKVATGSAQAAAIEFEFLVDTSRALSLDISAVGIQFAQLAAAARGTTLAGEGVREIFRAISTASLVLGLSAEQTSGALKALQQIISKGTVQAEELRGQLGERIPGAFQIAARAMGVTTKELGKLLKLGLVPSEEFVRKFSVALLEMVEPQVEDALTQLSAAIQGLKTEFFLFFKTLEDNTGIISGFARELITFKEGMRFLTDLMSSSNNLQAQLGEINEALEKNARLTSNLTRTQEGLGKIFSKTGARATELEKRLGQLFVERLLLEERRRKLIQALGGTPFGPDAPPLTFDELRNLPIEEVDKFRDSLKDLAGMMKVLKDNSLSISDRLGIVEEFERTQKATEMVTKVISKLSGDELSALRTKFDGSQRSMEEVRDILTRLIERFLKLQKTVKDTTKELTDLEKFKKAAEKRFFTTIVPRGEGITLPRVGGISSVTIANERQDLNREIADTIKLIEKENDILRLRIRGLETEARMMEIRNAIEREFGSDLLPKTIEELVKVQLENDRLLDKLQEVDEFRHILEDGFRDLGSTMVEVIKTGEGAFEGLINVLNRTLEAILDLIIQLIIINPLLNAMDRGNRPTDIGGLTDLVTGAASFIGGLFGGGVSAGRAGTAGTSIPGGIGGFAHGGEFTVGGAGGIDDTLVKFRATRGEKVTVTPAGEGSTENMTVINFNFPPGTNVKEFGDAQNQIAAMLAGTLSSASASNS